MWVTKKQYGGDVVMFLPNKIIKNKNLNYPQKNVGLAHGFKTMCMVLKLCAQPCARPSKTMYNKTMGCLEGLAHGFKTMYKAS